MGKVFITLILLALLGLGVLFGYAYSGLLQPDVETVTQPVTLDVD